MTQNSNRSACIPFARIGHVLLIQALTFCLLFIGDAQGSEAPKVSNSDAPKDKYERTAFADTVLYGQLRKKFRIEDVLMSKVNYPPPHSQWRDSQKEFYQALLKGQHYDVLVVPFQTMANGVDLPGRMLMSYRLALAIERNTKRKVAPLRLVYPALGAMARFYDEKEVLALGKMLGVSRIIWGYAGTRDFSGAENIQFSFAVVDQSAGASLEKSRVTHKSWPYEDLAPDVLPFHLFETRIADVLDFLKISRQASSSRLFPAKVETLSVPESPESLIDGRHYSPVYQSYLLQMLAMLAPTEHHKKLLYTHSLINMFQIAKNDPDRRLIEARAYIHLYRRPAAIKALSGIETKESDALMAYINANLPELEEKTASLKPSIKKLLAQLEVFSLKNKYKQTVTDDDKDTFISNYPHWRYFLNIVLNHRSRWKRSSNVELKIILDRLFPVPGFAAKDMAVGYKLKEVGGDNRLQFELLFQKHIQLAISGLKDELAGAAHTHALGADHLLTMLDSIGIFNLLQEIGFYSFTQGRPDEGLRICDEILRVYDGHPYFAIYKGMTLSRTMKLRQAEEKKAVISQRFKLVLNAVWWNGCQNWVHARAIKYTLKPPKNETYFINPADLMRAIDSDYPFRTNVAGLRRRPGSMLLPWVHTEIRCHENMYYSMLFKRRIDKANAALLDLKSRFEGNPEKIQVLASIKLIEPRPVGPGMIPPGTTGRGMKRPMPIDPKHLPKDFKPLGPLAGKVSNKERKALFLKEVEKNSQDWKTYKSLAQIYIEEEDFPSAQEIMLNYPKIKNPDQFNSVDVSNIAHTAGELLYWKGAAELSRPFFQLSDQLDTGSAASLESKEYLSVLDSDFDTALEYAFHRAKRYSSSHAYSRCMTYMHLLGDHDTAWSLFKSLLGRYDGPQIWYSASTGHRIQGTAPEQLIDWMHRIARLSPAEKQKGYVAHFGIWLLSDHAPCPELLGAIEELDVPPKVLMPNIFNAFNRSQAKIGGEVQQSKPPTLFYSAFARAYDLLRKRKYEAAFDAFYKEMDHFGWGYGNPGRTLKSYLVWAGVKSSNADTIEKKIIRRFKGSRFPRGREFDVELSYAAYEGGIGNHEKALKYLKGAFASEYLGESRLFSTWYQLVELCGWLYADSGDQRYRKLALGWARAYQRIQPMTAWAYEVEFNLTDNRKAKIKALAFAQRLNPQSKHISGIDKQLKEEAAKWMEKHNPFILKPKEARLSKIHFF